MVLCPTGRRLSPPRQPQVPQQDGLLCATSQTIAGLRACGMAGLRDGGGAGLLFASPYLDSHLCPSTGGILIKSLGSPSCIAKSSLRPHPTWSPSNQVRARPPAVSMRPGITGSSRPSRRADIAMILCHSLIRPLSSQAAPCAVRQREMSILTARDSGIPDLREGYHEI